MDARKWAAVAAACAVVCGGTSARADSPVAVTVTAPEETTTITVADVAHRVRVGRAEGGRLTLHQLQDEALQLLITSAWIDGEATERGLAPTSAQLRASFRRQMRESFPTRADFRRFLRRSRQTVADVRTRVRTDLEADRVRDQVTAPARATVTDAVVDAAVRAEGPQKTPETRDFRFVLARSRAAALRARAALAAGASWAAEHGRLWRRARRSALLRDLAAAVFRARVDRLTGPVRTRAGYYVLAVVHVHRPRPIPPARQRARVRARLVADAEQKAMEDFIAGWQAKWRARTSCAPAFSWHSDCGNR